MKDQMLGRGRPAPTCSGRRITDRLVRSPVAAALLGACGGSSKGGEQHREAEGPRRKTAGTSFVLGRARPPDRLRARPPSDTNSASAATSRSLDPDLIKAGTDYYYASNVLRAADAPQPAGSTGARAGHQLDRIPRTALTYTFQLRTGVTFQNGDPMTSADVVLQLPNGSSTRRSATSSPTSWPTCNRSPHGPQHRGGEAQDAGRGVYRRRRLRHRSCR